MKDLKKIILIAVCLFICKANIYSDPSLSLLKKLYTVNTEYFDIIYSSESENTAFAIANSCDELYEKAAAFFNEEIKGKVSLDILVNNAGITRDGFLMRMRDEVFDAVHVDTFQNIVCRVMLDAGGAVDDGIKRDIAQPGKE